MINLLKFLSLSLFALVYANRCSSQAPALRQITGLRSTEVYDLLTDSKGFLWIAHDAGISKYDGISFTNFSNPQQASLATTNLLEDKLGRIWFINFTGQIFYIENGHMTLLDAYKSASESVFPRMGLLGNLLVATSKKGLFICDINTLQCHYEHCINAPNRSTSSLCILKDKVLLYGSGYWFIYQPRTGLKTAVLKGDDGQISNSLTLSRSTYKDTSFMFRNPSNTFYKLWVSNDTVKVCEQKQFDSFINTISIVNNKYWINSINSSLPNDSKVKSIKGYNISCIAVDKEGHCWYGSLQHGILTDSLRSDTLQSNCLVHLSKNDLIKCMVKKGKTLLLGTQSGMLISYNTITNQSALLTTLPVSHGGITYLKLLNDDNILIGSPVYTYIFQIKSHFLKSIDLVTSLKQADQVDGALLMASSNSMIVLPDKDDQYTFDIFKKRFKGLVDKKYTIYGSNSRFLSFGKRSRAICYSPDTQTIWVSTKDGLYKINSSGISPFYLDNLPVFASCLTAHDNLVIIGTFNNGIRILKGNHVKSLTSDDGLLSNDIVNIEVINSNLWVHTSGSIQIFSLETFKLIYKYPFPTADNIFLTDANELDNNCYFTVLNGLYKIRPVQKKGDTVGIYLNSLFINHKDTSIVNNLKLPYLLNDIQISLGTPYLFDAKDIVIKYRLEDNDSTKWLYARPGERNFHFASLMPGDYQFEALAIKPQSGLSSKPFIMTFTIRRPWWQTWWFESLETVTFLLIVVGVLRYYYLNKLNRQKLQFEKELIAEKERQHISREIHDHIGQALSVIKLNLNMNSQIDDTKELVSEVMDDLRQFTHGLYHGKLLKGSLTDTIKKDVERLNISNQLVASLDISETVNAINPENQLLIYRIFQEAISNILKHAGAKNIFVRMTSDKKHLKLTITDDGIGFSGEGKRKGLGLDSMRRRAKLLKGNLTVFSKPQEGCKIELIINHVQKL
jgi:signal transduction histidine kinase/ligand-binding sensor domain-containing protein